MTDSILHPCPKPRKRKARAPKGLKTRVRMKCYNAKRKGRAFGAACRDDEFCAWMRRRWHCQVCADGGYTQQSRTEVDHWVPRSHGGKDKGDTWPLCREHHHMRHAEPVAFAKLLRVLRIRPAQSCKWYATQYDKERYPCP